MTVPSWSDSAARSSPSISATSSGSAGTSGALSSTARRRSASPSSANALRIVIWVCVTFMHYIVRPA
jgi:hypothetical protein